MKETLDKLKIISHSDEPFVDRLEAGDLLAEELVCLKDPQTIVLGIPRGGLVVARQAARGLGVPLDIVLSRKLGAPQNPELAVGSITEYGKVFLDEDLARQVGADQDYLDGEIRRQFSEIQRRRQVYRQTCPKADLKNKNVIIIDDGVATGSTVQAAIWGVHQEGPQKIIGAFPVGPYETLQDLLHSADEIVCLRVPSFLEGIGRFYIHFEQTSEEEVFNILKECGRNP